MNSLYICLIGCFTGFMLSAPIGPANILCLQKTVSYGRFSGFMTGIGASFGDFLFVIATLIGLLALGDIPFFIVHIMRYGGGGILAILGIWGLFQSRDMRRLDIMPNKSSFQDKIFLRVFKDFMTSFMMTVTNPLTLLGVVAAVSSVGLGGGLLTEGKISLSLIFALGVLCGSVLWWLFLSSVGEMFLRKLDVKILYIIQYVTSLAMLLLGFGLIILGDRLF